MTPTRRARPSARYRSSAKVVWTDCQMTFALRTLQKGQFHIDCRSLENSAAEAGVSSVVAPALFLTGVDATHRGRAPPRAGSRVWGAAI